MNILESAISLIAPHNCIVCRKTGDILCKTCSLAYLSPQPSRCYRCHQATNQSKTCLNCRRKTGIYRAWVVTSYENTAKELVYKLKFDRAKAASTVIARTIDESMPILPEGTVITHLPTANSRIRMRGYDQAQLIAKNLAKTRKMSYKSLLQRKGSSRQVGASRQSRFDQLKDVFHASNKSIQGAHILLVDDVLTTGASVESAAKELKSNGAKTVEIAVFAQP